MKHPRFFGSLLAAAVPATLLLVGATPAYALDTDIAVQECALFDVSFEGYQTTPDDSTPNTITVEIDGVTVEETVFGESFIRSYVLDDPYVAHEYEVEVTSPSEETSEPLVEKEVGTTLPCPPPAEPVAPEFIPIETCGTYGSVKVDETTAGITYVIEPADAKEGEVVVTALQEQAIGDPVVAGTWTYQLGEYTECPPESTTEASTETAEAPTPAAPEPTIEPEPTLEPTPEATTESAPETTPEATAASAATPEPAETTEEVAAAAETPAATSSPQLNSATPEAASQPMWLMSTVDGMPVLLRLALAFGAIALAIATSIWLWRRDSHTPATLPTY